MSWARRTREVAILRVNDHRTGESLVEGSGGRRDDFLVIDVQVGCPLSVVRFTELEGATDTQPQGLLLASGIIQSGDQLLGDDG